MESYNGILYSKIDALYLIEAVRNDLIPTVTQRLTRLERNRYIKSGSVFIWNERISTIKRWTDGRKWSASRVTGTFLTYREMKAPNAKDQSCHIVDFKNDGLIKQSFSYNIGEDKYHIVSYMEIKENQHSLQRPCKDPRFQSLKVTAYIDEAIGTQPTYSCKCKSRAKCDSFEEHVTCRQDSTDPSISTSRHNSEGSITSISSIESLSESKAMSKEMVVAPLVPSTARTTSLPETTIATTSLSRSPSPTSGTGLAPTASTPTTKISGTAVLPPVSSLNIHFDANTPRTSSMSFSNIFPGKLYHPLPLSISANSILPPAKRTRLV